MRSLDNRIKQIEKQLSIDGGESMEIIMVQDERNGDTDETTKRKLEELREKTGKNYRIGMLLIVQMLCNENIDED